MGGIFPGVGNVEISYSSRENPVSYDDLCQLSFLMHVIRLFQEIFMPVCQNACINIAECMHKYY